MFLNYLKIAWRNFRRERIFSWINVLGLATGITCFLLLFLYILNEYRYDERMPANTYRLYVSTAIRGEEGNSSKTSGALGPALLADFPEVRSFTRIGYMGPRSFKHGENQFRTGRIYAVDSTFFTFFPPTFIEGNPRTALREPNTIVLSETMARRIFGDKTAAGQTLLTDRGQTLMVTGVVKDFDGEYHFGCDILESTLSYEINQNWLDLWYSTYIQLAAGTSKEAFQEKLIPFVKKSVGPEAERVLGVTMEQFAQSGNRYEFNLQPTSDIYLESYRWYRIDPNTEWSDVQMGDILYVYIFSAIALFILLLAIINFMNLATAKSDRRAREVGIRKTFGSGKTKLVLQFVSEAIMMTAIAMVLAFVCVHLLLPAFSNLIGKQLHFVLINGYITALALAGFVIFVGVLGGSYPAFYLTSFHPNAVLKGGYKGHQGSEAIRSVLVVMQFSIGIALLIGTFVINRQLHYLQNKGLGFNKEHLLMINNGAALGSHITAFRKSLVQHPNITAVTNASRMFRAGIPGTGFLFNTKTGTDAVLCQYLDVDYDFLKTYEVQLQSGRFFSEDFPADTGNVVINEAAARAFGNTNPVGYEITSLDFRENGRSYPIIGVVSDFNYESLHTQVRPLVLYLGPVRQPASIVTIRVANADLPGTLAFIEKQWQSFVEGEAKMDLTFTNEALNTLYEKEARTRTVSTIFSGLAMFIACIGLFGLAAFVTEQRTKEIGVRKILGASIGKIIILLTREFAVWVMIANLVAWPVAFLVLNIWLSNFAYRTDLDIWVFLSAALITLAIALITVTLHTFKAARANPAHSLKHE